MSFMDSSTRPNSNVSANVGAQRFAEIRAPGRGHCPQLAATRAGVLNLSFHNHEVCGKVARDPAVQSELRQNQRRTAMAQKVIDVVGTSKESFAKAAENAVAEAAKTVRGMKWARVAELEMELDGKKIVKYRATTKIYFDIEK